MSRYPQPAACHPERCIEFSGDVALTVGATDPCILRVECNRCATVVTLFTDDECIVAGRAAARHAESHAVWPDEKAAVERWHRWLAEQQPAPSSLLLPILLCVAAAEVIIALLFKAVG